MDGPIATQTDAYDVPGFCRAHGDMSRSLLYKLWDEGLGPARMRAGKRVLISREAAAEWRRKMEAQTAEAIEA